MPIDQRTQIQMQQVLDQENAAIAETLECEEYLLLLWAALSSAIRGMNDSIKNPNVTPECTAIIQWNIIDLITVLRLAQVKMAEFLLKEESEAA